MTYSHTNLPKLGTKVKFVNYGDSILPFKNSGTYAGLTKLTDGPGALAIVILEEPTETNLAVIFPIVCIADLE